jgi:hypothetical protein
LSHEDLIFLTWENKWYLHQDSSFQHSFHSKLDHSTTTLGENDLQNKYLKLVSFNDYFVSFFIVATGIYSICILLWKVNVLYDDNEPPSTISKIMSTHCKDDKKHLFLRQFSTSQKKQEPTKHGKWNTAINGPG